VLTRAALANIDELHGADTHRATLNLALGRALLAQKRFAEAREAVQKARTFAESAAPLPRVLAGIDADLARAEAGLGMRAAAVARARRARAVLANYRGELVERRAVDEVLR